MGRHRTAIFSLQYKYKNYLFFSIARSSISFFFYLPHFVRIISNVVYSKQKMDCEMFFNGVSLSMSSELKEQPNTPNENGHKLTDTHISWTG